MELSPAEQIAIAQEHGYGSVVALQRMGDPTRRERLLLERGIPPRTWTGDRYGDRWEVDPVRGGPTEVVTGKFIVFEPDGMYHAYAGDRHVGKFDEWLSAVRILGPRLEASRAAPPQKMGAVCIRGRWSSLSTARQLDWEFPACYFEQEVQCFVDGRAGWSDEDVERAIVGLKTVFTNLSTEDQEKTQHLWDQL